MPADSGVAVRLRKLVVIVVVHLGIERIAEARAAIVRGPNVVVLDMTVMLTVAENWTAGISISNAERFAREVVVVDVIRKWILSTIPVDFQQLGGVRLTVGTHVAAIVEILNRCRLRIDASVLPVGRGFRQALKCVVVNLKDGLCPSARRPSDFAGEAHIPCTGVAVGSSYVVDANLLSTVGAGDVGAAIILTVETCVNVVTGSDLHGKW